MYHNPYKRLQIKNETIILKNDFSHESPNESLLSTSYTYKNKHHKHYNILT